MILEVSILVLAVATNLLLAFLVYLRNNRSATHRLFSILGLSLVVWSVINYFAVNAHGNPAATWLVRLVMFSSTPLGVFFFLLMHTFPRATLALSRRKFSILMALMVLTMVVSLTPLLFPVVTPQADQAPQPQPGIGMVLYVPTVIFSIIYGIYLLIRKTLKAKGLQRVQMAYLLTGVTVMFTLIIGLNFIAVTVLKTTFFTTYGPLFTLPFTVLAAYTIIRHRLLDIRIVVFRALAFSVLTASFLGLYGLLLYLVTLYFSQFELTALQHIILGIGSVALAIPSYHYFRLFLQKFTDRFLFQDRPDYKQSLVEFGQALSRTIQIEEVATIILKAIQEVVRSKKVVIMLRNTAGKMVPMKFNGTYKFSTIIANDHLLLKYLRHTQAPIVKDELVILKEREPSVEHVKELAEIERSLAELDVSVVVPLIAKKELMGILLLGDKQSGKPYLQDDIEFLNAFIPQASTALENARLYRESLNFGERLSKEVDMATRDLQKANKHLKELMNIKTEFLHIASHQLRTPLTSLRGFLGMQAEGELDKLPKKKRRELQQNMLSGANQLNSIVNDLLDAMELEGGSLNFKIEPVQVETLIEEAINSLKLNYDKKGLSLVFEKPEPALPKLEADPSYLRQVFLNVIDNAEKYTEKGGVTVQATLKDNEIEVAITDTGMGVDPAEIPKLFGKFVRGQRSEQMFTDGSGLGLFIIKKIVEEHNGRVILKSEGIAKGTTVKVILPLQQPR